MAKSQKRLMQAQAEKFKKNNLDLFRQLASRLHDKAFLIKKAYNAQ